MAETPEQDVITEISPPLSPSTDTADKEGKSPVKRESTSSVGYFKRFFPPARQPPGGQVLVERRFYTQDQLDEAFPHPLETASLCDQLKEWCRARCSASRVVKSMLGFLPLVRVLRYYSWGSWLFVDLLSGLSVGFLHIPQALGFGLLANLSPVHGLYTSIFPVLVYMVFGTSPHVSMGTNAVVALLSASIIGIEAQHFLKGQPNTTVTPAEFLDYKVGVSTTAALLEGIILIGMGLLRMGFLTNYMSISFIGGFSFAAAIHITVSQVVKLFHLKIDIRSGAGKLIFTTIDVFRNITDTNIADIVVGVICGVLILGINMGINQRYKHKLKMPIPAELIVVILSTLVSHLAQLNDRFNVDIVGDIPRGFPVPMAPPMDNLVRILPLVFVDAVLIFVLTITLAKLTAKLHDINIDDNQELVAYGLCQVVGSFFQNFSSSISPPRTMMLSSLGSKSTLNGLSTTIFLLVVLLAAGPLFESLPIAMLAVMIIVAMKDLLLQVGKLPSMWYVNKGDFFIWTFTVLFSVLGDLDMGLVAGTLSSMVMVLAYSQLAKGILLGKASDEDLYLDMDRQGIHAIPGLRIFRFESQLHFASAERFKSEIYRKIFDPTSVSHKDHYEIDVRVRPGRPCLSSSQSSQVEDPTSPGQYPKGFSPPQCGFSPDRLSPESVDKSPTYSPSGKKIRSNFTGLSGSIDVIPDDLSNNAMKVQPATSWGAQDKDQVRYVILDCSTMTYVDLTGVETLHLIITQFSRAGVAILLTDIPPTTLAILNRVNFFQHENYSKVYYNVQDAVHDISCLPPNRHFRKSFA